MYYLLALINLAIFAIYFRKDPVAATAIFCGILVALTVSGLITLIINLVNRKENHHDEA